MPSIGSSVDITCLRKELVNGEDRSIEISQTKIQRGKG
jgi:hypothetical protein